MIRLTKLDINDILFAEILDEILYALETQVERETAQKHVAHLRQSLEKGYSNGLLIQHDNRAIGLATYEFRKQRLQLHPLFIRFGAEKEGLRLPAIQAVVNALRENSRVDIIKSNQLFYDTQIPQFKIAEQLGFQVIERLGMELNLSDFKRPPPPLMEGYQLVHWQSGYIRETTLVLHEAFSGTPAEIAFPEMFRSVKALYETLKNVVRGRQYGRFDRFSSFAVLHLDQLCGGLLTTHNPDGALIAAIAVSPAHQGRGLGEAMLINCFNSLKACGLKQVTLGCEADNIPAVNLYKKLGFWVSSRYHIYSWFRGWEEGRRPSTVKPESEICNILLFPKRLRVVKRGSEGRNADCGMQDCEG